MTTASWPCRTCSTARWTPWSSTKAPAQEFVAANPGLVILDTEYANEDYAIGVAKGNTALVDAVNGALAELTADGTIQSIIEKYIPAEG